MEVNYKTFNFKPSPIEIEIKDLKFIKELPKLLGTAHKTTFYQVVWLSEGEMILHIDFKEIHLFANQLLIISTGQLCQFDTQSKYKGKIILFTSSFFNVTELDSNFLYTSEVLNPVSLNKVVNLCPTFMQHIIEMLSTELKEEVDDFQKQITQSYLRILLLEIERRVKKTHQILESSIARQFYSAVEQHFLDNKSVEYYANLLSISVKRLGAELKSLKGITPKSYIDSRVILEAKRLIVYSSLSIKEIAITLGFDEPTNFNKYFKKHTNTTPLQFREQINK